MSKSEKQLRQVLECVADSITNLPKTYKDSLCKLHTDPNSINSMPKEKILELVQKGIITIFDMLEECLFIDVKAEDHIETFGEGFSEETLNEIISKHFIDMLCVGNRTERIEHIIGEDLPY